LISVEVLFTSSGMDSMEYSEWIENSYITSFDVYFTTTSLFFTIGGDNNQVIKPLYEFLKRNNMTYNPLKINPMTGQYGFSSMWLYTL
jgi:hypothetical protein